MAELLKLGRVGAVARNTFREVARNRAFTALMLFAVAFVLAAALLAELTVTGQGSRVVVDFGFFAVGLIGAVTAIAMGTMLVHKEVDRKTVHTIVSKPIRRYEFMLGKYGGLLGVLAVEVGILAAVWAGMLLWEGADVGLAHLKGMLLVLLEVGVVASVAVMFSSRTSPTVTGVLSVGVFLVGRSVGLLEEMLAKKEGVFAESPLMATVAEVAIEVFPDLGVFRVSQQIVLDVAVRWSYVGHAALYAASYAAIFLVLGMIAFEQRDFT